MTAAQFDTYAALVLGDPTCGSIRAITAAEENRATWSPVVDGNIVMIGTDPVFHEDQGGGQLTDSAMAYAWPRRDDQPLLHRRAATTMAPRTARPFLCSTGSGRSRSATPVLQDAHIVAEHPALAGLDDGDLSGWNCSVHEVFQGLAAELRRPCHRGELRGRVHGARRDRRLALHPRRWRDNVVTSDIDLARRPRPTRSTVRIADGRRLDQERTDRRDHGDVLRHRRTACRHVRHRCD